MDSYSRNNADTAPVTEALPAPVLLATPHEDAPPLDHLAQVQPEDEPFIPRKKYTPGRSTKALVCVLLVVAGFFGGSMVQKQIDLGNRGARNFSNFQGTNGRGGAGAGTGNGPGSQTSATQGPGQGRRGGNGGTAPTGAAGQ